MTGQGELFLSHRGGGRALKWGGYNRKAEERMKRLFSGKSVWYLLTLAVLGLLLAQNIKWHP